MNFTEILVIASTLDFTSDYVCLELKRRGKNYLRINRDEFDKYEIQFDINRMILNIQIEGINYCLDEQSLKAIYYRAPIYLRDIYQPNIDMEEQLFRTQWTAFIRNLSIFENIIWINNPVSTFKAENKLLQLKYAEKIGLRYPKTTVSNTNEVQLDKDEYYIVKSLDTALLRTDEKEAFVYSSVIKGLEILQANLKISPVVIQEYIFPKIDIRVSVIGDKTYAVKIVQDQKGIDGDWRLQKHNLSYVPILLSTDIEQKCIQLVKNLGLVFGGIDLIESNGEYYFIEVNPTGEWAWLVDAAGLQIYEAIVDYLEGEQ
ncbi:ATP-grasp domain-containing protein [Peribacillus sp. Hz7]|uniref:ATP-grasp domain-containing protein n=1 Tax=Peribacillus sp. Hz7 TaxID=3344873 RepID=UPI0035CBB559